jgi:ubiquinone/menaquinone biosynthesis C-methylase UbiE
MNNRTIAEYWDDSSDFWYRDYDSHLSEIIDKPEIAFPESVYRILNNTFSSFKDLKVCVPSSGDNTAVFAFHLLGAHVTSVDISKKQIENAQKIAIKNNWNIHFICDDSMFLNKIEDESFDLVYTSNGVHVWISDLSSMYGSFNRILKPNGKYIFFESHPMSRPFNNNGNEIKIVKEYSNTGPFIDDDISTYEWRMQDFVNSLVKSSFEVCEMIEFNSSERDFIKYDYLYESVEERIRDDYRKYNWLENPWAALPQCLGMMTRKKSIRLKKYNN